MERIANRQFMQTDFQYVHFVLLKVVEVIDTFADGYFMAVIFIFAL